MIQTYDLTKKFEDFTAVDRINLNVESGNIYILLGPNGAGKTTTVRMLTSILPPSSGKAFVAGFDVVEQPQKVRASVGVLTESHGLYVRMRAEEYLEFFARLYEIEENKIKPRIHELLEKFGLLDAIGKRLGEYSKGMRQKLSLARAMIHDPKVLLLDEPTSAMDPYSSRMVRDSILKLRSDDHTVILCTHNLTEAEELADQVAIIQSGRIIQSDTPAELKRKLLGPPKYDVFLAGDHTGDINHLPGMIKLLERSADHLVFEIQDPQKDNPQLLENLLQKGMKVKTFQEVPTTLEQAYLEAVKQEGGQYVEAA